MFGRGLQLKANVQLVFFLWLVKCFKKLVNSRLVEYDEKFGLFCHSSAKVGLEWFWKESFHKDIPFMLLFFNAIFLGPTHFPTMY